MTPAFLLIAATMTTPANTQTTNLDAVVIVRPAQPVLSIASKSDLNFGKVSLPSGTVTSCVYTLAFDGTRSSLANGTATTNACGFQDTAQSTGGIEIVCQSDRAVNYSLAVEAPLEAQGVGFAVPADAAGFAESGERRTVSGCVGGASRFRVGGRLTVAASTQPMVSATVGRITIDIYYGDAVCTGCQ